MTEELIEDKIFALTHKSAFPQELGRNFQTLVFYKSKGGNFSFFCLTFWREIQTHTMDTDCKVCMRNGTGEDIVCCDHCHEWTHFGCANLNKVLVDRIRNFFCNDCTSPERITSWYRQERNEQQLAEKPLYFDVSSIMGHKLSDSGREFLVSWKPTGRGSTKTTHRPSWEPEKNLDGAIDILQQYCRENSLAYSEIEGLMGADETEEDARVKNWVSMEKVLSTLEKYRISFRVRSTIKAEEWTEFGQEDKLFYLKYGPHCFVLLYIASKETAYIADGGNVFRRNFTISQEIKELLDIRLISLPFRQQVKADYCGSSAILIGIELLRLYDQGMSYTEVFCSKSMRRMLTTLLHKAESKSTVAPLGIVEQRLYCETCGKSYRQTQRKALKLHIRRAHSAQP